MFKKLDYTISNFNALPYMGKNVFNNPTFKEFELINRIDFLNEWKSKIHFGITPDRINFTKIIYPGSRPHTDSWPTALNVYLDANDDETCFWKEKTESGKKGLAGYNLDSLQQIGSFVARKNDCYLLDVSTIHSIAMQTENSERLMLRFIWYRHSVTEVFNSIIIK